MVRHNFIRIGKTKLKPNHARRHATRADSAINPRPVDPAKDQGKIEIELEGKSIPERVTTDQYRRRPARKSREIINEFCLRDD